MNFNASFSFADTLKQALAEKAKVTVYLRGNASFSGTVADVGDHAVVIANLQGRDFSDALIRLDQVTAVEARVRGK